jgi:hypothetical protein
LCSSGPFAGSFGLGCGFAPESLPARVICDDWCMCESSKIKVQRFLFAVDWAFNKNMMQHDVCGFSCMFRFGSSVFNMCMPQRLACMPCPLNHALVHWMCLLLQSGMGVCIPISTGYELKGYPAFSST